MATNSTSTGDDQPNLWLGAGARSRLELARAEAELKFRDGIEALVNAGGSMSLEKIDELLMEYVHVLFFAFAREATCGISDVWIVRRALETHLSKMIDRAYTSRHPIARTPASRLFRKSFFARCEFVIANSPAWHSLQEILREHAQIEIDCARKDGEFGKCLIKLKEEAGITWDTLAHESGIARRQLFTIKAGEAKAMIETKRALSRYFSDQLKRQIDVDLEDPH